MAGKQKRKQDEETTYWLSYSDMMAGLLLVFVLIISMTVLHAKIQYDEKETQLLGKEKELIIQSEELENERLTVEEQGAKLNAQELKLSDQENKLKLQRAQLLDQENKLMEQSALLENLQNIMSSQQAKLDRIIGVRSELIQALKAEFDGSDLLIAVDEKTGAITMDSSILFSYNQDTLKDTGKDFLARFLPKYTNILLSPQYSSYVSEIVIEGHTDTTGNYLFNLDLSQKRAYSVAAYCMTGKLLDANQQKALENVLTSCGRSYSDPIYNADGTVNAEASRRVEILFRLKDEEMIREMIEILNNTDGTAAAVPGTPVAAGPGGAVVTNVVEATAGPQ